MRKSPDARPSSAAEAGALLDLIERDRGAAATALGVALTGTPPPAPSRAAIAPPDPAATERVAGLQAAPAVRALAPQPPPTRPPPTPGGRSPELPFARARRGPGLPFAATMQVAPIGPPAAPIRLRRPDLLGFGAGIVLAAAVAAVTVLVALVALHLHR
jgi:hypothetical protein